MAKRYATLGTFTFPPPNEQQYSAKRASLFFRYWIRLPKRQGQRPPLSEEEITKIVVRLYRAWPRRKFDLKAQNREIARWDGACPYTQGTWESALLERFGSGRYEIFLNEEGVSGALCSSKITLHDEQYPPKVAVEDLDLLHPDNQQYLQGLRDSGVTLPGDETYQTIEQQQEAEVAETVQSELLRGVMDLKQEVAEIKATSGSAAAGAASAAAANESATVKAVLDFAREARERPNGDDGAKMISVLLAALKDLRPDDSVYRALSERANKLEEALLNASRESREQILEERNFFRDLVTTTRDAQAKSAAAAAAAPAERPPDLIQQVRQARELLETLQQGIGAGSAPAARVSVIERLAPTVLATVDRAINAFTMARAQQQQAAPVPGQFGYMPATPALAGMPADAGPAAGVQQPQPAAAMPADQDTMAALRAGLPPEVIPQLRRLTPAFCAHFVNSPSTTSGYTFADWIVTGGIGAGATQEGRTEYEMMKAMGADQIAMVLKVWPPTARVVGGFPPEKLSQFLEEFLHLDEWLENQDGQDRPAA